ncbi:aldo/keto reductase [Lachnospiraceae bacterium 45-W7]
MNNVHEFFVLNNEVKIPKLAYGTYKAADGETYINIQTAIESGYRCFDTASFYGTERSLAKAIGQSKVQREDIFIASKVWKTEMGYEETKAAFTRTLENLGTDYLDLYLMHWPLPSPDFKEWKQLDLDTWRAMEELYHAGKIRALGLSNFLPHHIDNILENCQVPPMVNQIEFHPGHTQESVRRYCEEHNILVQAWSPLGRGRVLKDSLIAGLAEKYRVSAAQICLRFALQKGVMPLVKASSMERMKENQDVFSFALTKEELYQIDTMPPLGWSGEHPDRERQYV